MNVEIIIPFAGGCMHRARALAWVIAHAPYRVTVTKAPAGPWRKAAAVNPAVADSRADIVIVMDGDVHVEAGGMQAAVQAVADGAPWAIPHTLVHRLSATATDRLLAGEALLDTGMPGGLDQAPYLGIAGGGVVVATAATLRRIPLDERFIGWGQEDVAWGLALRVLAGQPWRGDADLIHLWHPPQQRMNRKIGSVAGQQLCRRYLAARRDPAAMLALIQEVTTCPSPTC